ncbi:hypothetical protein AB1Y20_015133 [Prymnesium parvum]|uniref:Cell growth-regulating nucleolar protein-like winged helix domain-containing protein n=1 Tax=Prymnesium parvum TaxID=97485 RepID=A0AB34JZW1_PRYPA
MEAKKLASLHAQLEEGAASRGGKTGGLGFDAKDAKAQKSKQKASGAVAAGHWDPWARPVEYELKKVNRSAGTLTSMFVRGETMGGTIEKERAAAPEASDGEETPKKKSRAAHRDADKKFNWRKAIKKELKTAGGCKRLKQLRQAVCTAFLGHARAPDSAAVKESARLIFRKRLTKLDDILVVENGQVRLRKQ